jgi:4-aminobutyrate aminotransferase-like enzyme
VLAAMHEQLDRFVHGGWQLSSPARAELAERLRALSPWDDAAVLFTTTGSEAVEGALKIARAATGRATVLGFLGGYHGKTAGALGVTAKASYRAGVTDRPVAQLSLPFAAAERYVAADAPAATGHDFGRAILEHPDFGLEDVAALVVEVVQGSGGMAAAAPGLLRELREFTSRHGILLVVDEIFTGLGRTGAWWGHMHDGVVPDLVVAGKAMGGGLPVGAVVGPRPLLESLRPLQQTSTFSANPVACAGGVAVLDAIRDLGLDARSVRLGARLASALAGPGVVPIGRGLMLGARLLDAEGGPAAEVAREVVLGMRERGVLVLRGGAEGNVVKFTPPLTIEEEVLDAVASAFAEALEEAAARR